MEQTFFWETWWFLLIVGLLAALIGYKMYEYVTKFEQKKNELNAKLIQSKLIALRSQMNPHFMFNSLNSIQDFIIHSDKKAANKYLSKFSKLMRSILSMSDKESVSLSEEVKTLDIYLQLEGLRFSENFEYEINVADNISPDKYYLPPMILQPYVENAIKHGLLHKKGMKVLKVDFTIKDKKLHCRIEDNGVGRKESALIKSRNVQIHQSKGMSVTAERLDLLNNFFKDQLSVEIKDLYTDSGIASGTLVTVEINTDFAQNSRN